MILQDKTEASSDRFESRRSSVSCLAGEPWVSQPNVGKHDDC